MTDGREALLEVTAGPIGVTVGPSTATSSSDFTEEKS